MAPSSSHSSRSSHDPHLDIKSDGDDASLGGPSWTRVVHHAPDGEISSNRERLYKKPRQRSHSSPEFPSPSDIQARQSPIYPVTRSPINALYEASLASVSSATAAASIQRAPSVEDSLTLRRREANRLAAQRFRSRKKGYQDSLEERVRQLEEQRDILLGRLGEPPIGTSSFGPRLEEDSRGTTPFPMPGSSALFRASPRQSSFSSLSTSPEQRESITTLDPEIRFASLESANRKLQEEAKAISQENERLRAELHQWRRWEQDNREGRPGWTSDTRHETKSLDLPSQTSTPSDTYPNTSRRLFATAQETRAPLPPTSIHQGPFEGPEHVPIRLPPLRLGPPHSSNAENNLQRQRRPSPSFALPRAPELDLHSTAPSEYIRHKQSGTRANPHLDLRNQGGADGF